MNRFRRWQKFVRLAKALDGACLSAADYNGWQLGLRLEVWCPLCQHWISLSWAAGVPGNRRVSCPSCGAHFTPYVGTAIEEWPE